MALRNCEYYVILSLCGSELGRQVIFTSVLHSHKLFLQESSGIEDFIGYSFAVLIFWNLFLFLKLWAKFIVSFSVAFVYICVFWVIF